jgi:hypothetical protein
MIGIIGFCLANQWFGLQKSVVLLIGDIPMTDRSADNVWKGGWFIVTRTVYPVR